MSDHLKSKKHQTSAELSLDQMLQIWERAIETQMHFAELSIKMRQIGLTLSAGALAIIVILYRTENQYSFFIPVIDMRLPVASVLTLAAALILYSAKKVDVDVYHKMLRGSVDFNERFEVLIQKRIGWETGLTEAISAYSRYSVPYKASRRDKKQRIWRSGIRLSWWDKMQLRVGVSKQRVKKSSRAGTRIEKFYYYSITALVSLSLALTAFENLGGFIVNGST